MASGHTFTSLSVALLIVIVSTCTQGNTDIPEGTNPEYIFESTVSYINEETTQHEDVRFVDDTTFAMARDSLITAALDSSITRDEMYGASTRGYRVAESVTEANHALVTIGIEEDFTTEDARTADSNGQNAFQEIVTTEDSEPAATDLDVTATSDVNNEESATIADESVTQLETETATDNVIKNLEYTDEPSSSTFADIDEPTKSENEAILNLTQEDVTGFVGMTTMNREDIEQTTLNENVFRKEGGGETTEDDTIYTTVSVNTSSSTDSTDDGGRDKKGSDKEEDDTMPYVIAGAAGGAAILVIAGGVIFIILLVKRRRNTAANYTA